MALNGCEKSAKISGIKWYWTEKVQLFGLNFNGALGSIPKTHCDSSKRKSRIGTGDIGVISSTTTANDFAVIAKEINVMLPRFQG